MTLGKSLPFPLPQFLHLCKGFWDLWVLEIWGQMGV